MPATSASVDRGRPLGAGSGATNRVFSGRASQSSISTRASPMSRSRDRGFLRRQRSSSARTSGGVVLGSVSHAGSLLITSARMCPVVSPLKSARPLSISNRTTPNAQMSVRVSVACPAACSGLM